jgi:hypothetical protein
VIPLASATGHNEVLRYTIEHNSGRQDRTGSTVFAVSELKGVNIYTTSDIHTKGPLIWIGPPFDPRLTVTVTHHD